MNDPREAAEEHQRRLAHETWLRSQKAPTVPHIPSPPPAPQRDLEELVDPSGFAARKADFRAKLARLQGRENAFARAALINANRRYL